MDLDKQSALVTGAASGIGAAVCRALSAAGATVHVTDVDGAGAAGVADTIRAAGGAAHVHPLDVTDAAACERLIGGIADLSVLVTCAGWVEIHPLVDEDAAYWHRVTAVNFLGTVHACVPALRVMAGNGGGSIVTISSEAGRIGTPGEAVYAGAKAGVIGFTKSVAREGARAGVRANSVSPGVTDTPLLDSIDDDTRRRMLKGVPMRRLAQPEEIAAAVTFLASADAGFVTGEVLSVSGGLSMAG